MTDTTSDTAAFTAPGISRESGNSAATVLQERLHAVNDLALTLKHVHWNVTGPHFIGVHTMIDPHVEEVREMIDQIAERIALLGGSPCGTPGVLVAQRSWEDYPVGRADTTTHLKALDQVYVGLLEDQRKAIDELEEWDLVSQDLLVAHTQQLEVFQWFVRAHLEVPDSRADGGGRSAASS